MMSDSRNVAFGHDASRYFAGVGTGIPVQRAVYARYLIAAIAVFVAFSAREFASDELIHRLPFTFFIPAALVAGWYGGFGAGLAAFLGGLLLGDYFFLEPHNAFGPIAESGRLSIAIYTFTCFVAMCLLELRHAANWELAQRIDRLRSRAAEPQGAGVTPSTGLHDCLPDWICEFLYTTPENRSVRLRYTVAVGALVIGFALRYLSGDELTYRLAFAFFVPAILLAVWYGGFGPGLVALVGGLLLANYFFQPPHMAPFPLTGIGRASAGTYALTCLIWISVLELLHATNRNLEQELERVQRGEAQPPA